ncbi:zinc finger protein 570-like isoform X1 [Drosophila nasuta]|uniref:zinc finger protein 570-like isoform X1 n=1 Tax=Drosophila nasuta TaxID=42062 RepID=UPI00295F0A8B|nr:zinc finger protein 570-like isoform X1 [Drosophila nasuta]
MDICRVCLNSTVTLVDIFAKREQVDQANPEPCLADMLNEIAVCHVKLDDTFPQHICLSCVLGAQNAWRFKNKCESSYKQLIAIKEQQQQKEQQLLQQQEQQLKAKEEIVCEESKVIEIKLEPPEVEKETTTQAITLKPYKCGMCSKAFADVTILRVHKNWHAEIRSKAQAAVAQVTRKPIEKLQKTVKTKKEIKKFRKRTTDTSDRPFKCTECNQGFFKNLHLTRHMRIHTGECPYECPYCSEAFYRSDYRKRHIEYEHRVTDPAPKLRSRRASK